MPRDGWFDGRGLELNNSTLRQRRAEWARIRRDGRVPPDAAVHLRQAIYRRLQALEPQLADGLHAVLTEVLVDYEMLVDLHAQAVPRGAP